MEKECRWRGHPGGDDDGEPQERPARRVRGWPGVQRTLVHAIVLETLLGGAVAAEAEHEAPRAHDHPPP